MPHTWFLVPGYGSQGGKAADVVAAFDAHGLGAIVNNSRGLIFAHERPEYSARFAQNWQAAVEAATREMMDDLRTAGHDPRMKSDDKLPDWFVVRQGQVKGAPRGPANI
jgi:hypothetical protein